MTSQPALHRRIAMFFVGVDLGQRQDFTAICVVDRVEGAEFKRDSANAGLCGGVLDYSAEPEPWMLVARYLERMELGTPYTRVAERICEIVMHPALQDNCRLVVDATGVGRPVVDLLKSVGLGVMVTAVTITGGDSAHSKGEEWHVPRRDLLGNLQVLFEQRRLKIARKAGETERLMRELEAMSASGESGEHDDLVISIALGCWRAKRASVMFGTRPLLGIPPYLGSGY